MSVCVGVCVGVCWCVCACVCVCVCLCVCVLWGWWCVCVFGVVCVVWWGWVGGAVLLTSVANQRWISFKEYIYTLHTPVCPYYLSHAHSTSLEDISFHFRIMMICRDL